jgi:hypothetical protein
VGSPSGGNWQVFYFRTDSLAVDGYQEHFPFFRNNNNDNIFDDDDDNNNMNRINDNNDDDDNDSAAVMLVYFEGNVNKLHFSRRLLERAL